MIKIFTFTLLFAAQFTLLGQEYYGLKFNAGISSISNTFNPINSRITVQSAPSAQLGFLYNYQATRRSTFGAEFLLTQIGGKETTESDLVGSSGDTLGVSTSNFYQHITYLSIPMYYQYNLSKVSFNIGIQGSLAILKIAKSESQVIMNGNSSSSSNTIRDFDIDPYDFGIRTGIILKVNEKISIEGQYYHGLNDIRRADLLSFTRQISQTTIGLRYIFLTKEIEE